MRVLDEQDPLASFRQEFVIADRDLIYLDGNSLGRLPKRTVDRMHEIILDEWSTDLVQGWGKGWLSLPQRVGAKIARVVGANEDEVIACDSTSVNFYKLAHAALRAMPERCTIVSDSANFPSDLYLLQGMDPGRNLSIVEGDDPEAVIAALNEKVALLTLSHVSFKSGLLHDMEKLTGAAHDVGALVLWDLSHSAGVVPMRLREWEVDLAVGCTYKYLNGGPGSTAFLYVRRELQDELRSPIQGWFGQRDAFKFAIDYEPAHGIGRFMAGTPPILSLAATEMGVDLTLEAGIERIREKSQQQTSVLISLVEERLEPLGFELVTPKAPEARGSHVSLKHREAWRINQTLIREMKVVPDFRNPDVLRLGVAPLYNSYQELHEVVLRIEAVVRERRYERYSTDQGQVT